MKRMRYSGGRSLLDGIDVYDLYVDLVGLRWFAGRSKLYGFSGCSDPSPRKETGQVFLNGNTCPSKQGLKNKSLLHFP